MGRAGHHDGAVAAVPGNGQAPAMGLHVNLRVEQPEPDAGHHRRTGARATAERFAGAANSSRSVSVAASAAFVFGPGAFVIRLDHGRAIAILAVA